MCNRNIPLRLPKTVIPIHYNLTVTPDLNSFTFQGNLSIKLQILEQTKEIFLHAVDLNIKEVKIFSTHSESVNIINKYDFVKIVFEDFIPPGIWHLHFLYEGIINNDKRGLYRSKYNNENGNEKYMIVTQFAPTDSRRCFPCFDEPCFKSTFSLTVVVPNNLISLSNMPVKVKVQETNLLTRFEYQTTPIMPTYLLAFIVGEFDYVEDKFNKIRVYTPKLENKCATVALKYASESLSFYKNYFGMDYKVPKMDLISVVEFDFDAMENWGLIIFREDVLHPSTEKPSLHYKIRVAEVIGHEFAHQWFGNLVTMEWWNKLWLNEGFASYFQFIWLSHAFSLDVWEQFVDVTLEALHIDSLISSRSLEAPITEAEGILEVFDVITYRKGAAIIKMLHDFVGDDVFKNGIRKYLNQNKFGNTSSRHLWKAFGDFKNGLVGEVMASWINQTGYPLLEVSRKSEKGTVRLVISQKHFRHELQECNVLWKIPLIISYVTSDLTVQTIKLLLEQRETELKLYNIPTDCWIKVNRGYYRVQYTPDMLETLIPAIKYKTISSSDRLGILDDMFALMKYRKITSVCFLNFLKAYEKETFYIILKRMLSIFRYMSCLLEYHGLKEVFNKASILIFLCIN
ncbi:puromycin-sensitive aminopeptidase-like [Aethina tumida]|uniref:puromycin-sensitive aminopeptidase-like n=1 Tax=Aethina tumida TaxID=116153 RepID=UPI00214727EF|nr:puromycin-sensitive aminopeptidase-like [Aethina tumida]